MSFDLPVDGFAWQLAILLMMLFIFIVILVGIIVFVRINVRHDRKRVEDIASNVSILYKYTEETNRRLREADEKISALMKKAATLPPSVKSEVMAVEKSLFRASSLNEQVLSMCDAYMDQEGVEKASRTEIVLPPEPQIEEEPVVEEVPAMSLEEEERNFARKKAYYNISDDLFIQKLKELIDKNISNPELSVAQLAEELCVSRSGLFAKVKAATGDTPNNMIVDARLAKAQSLLEDGKRPISEICFMVGFSSPSYFSRCFDKKFGMTPHAWMHNRRKA